MERCGKDVADYLFAPCERYQLDPDLPEPEHPSCIYCIWQYAPGHVCPEFQKRLQQAADGLAGQKTKPREVEP